MPKRILVIDDEEAVRDAFVLALDGMDYIVDTASCGEAGLKKALENKPDLVFLDLKMPGIGGVETLQQLQSHYTKLPVYIVTAFYQEFMEPLKEAAARGFSLQVAQKPLSGEEIRLIVTSTLEKQQVY